MAVLLAVSCGDPAAYATLLRDTSDEPLYYGRCMVLFVVPLKTTKLRPGEVVRASKGEGSAVVGLDRDATYDIRYVIPMVPREKARIHMSDGTFESYDVALARPSSTAVLGFVTRPVIENSGGCF